MREVTVLDKPLTALEEQRLAEAEGVIARGLKTFYEVGRALMDVRDSRLYRRTHRTFEAYCQERWGMPSASARRLIGSTLVYDNLQSDRMRSLLPANERQASMLIGLQPDQQRNAWERAVETAPDGRVTAAHVAAVVEEIKNPMAVHYTSNTAEWLTPPDIIRRVIDMFQVIDLDPCSNSHETPNVSARQHYTKEDDGLSQPWAGYVYMNPPYGDEVGAWVEKLCREYTRPEPDRVALAIALLPARTDTAWFRPLWKYPLCFVWGRLTFSNAEHSAPFPSVVAYLGDAPEDFAYYFRDLGQIEVPMRQEDSTA